MYLVSFMHFAFVNIATLAKPHKINKTLWQPSHSGGMKALPIITQIAPYITTGTMTLLSQYHSNI